MTAALDAEIAHQVSSDILDLTGMTRIVVTHTLEESLLRRYDGILVLKDGRVNEFGSFDELMQRNGYFHALFTVCVAMLDLNITHCASKTHYFFSARCDIILTKGRR